VDESLTCMQPYYALILVVVELTSICFSIIAMLLFILSLLLRLGAVRLGCGSTYWQGSLDVY
jgi:hypothetical protein